MSVRMVGPKAETGRKQQLTALLGLSDDETSLLSDARGR
jgi:hypothetical protein